MKEMFKAPGHIDNPAEEKKESNEPLTEYEQRLKEHHENVAAIHDQIDWDKINKEEEEWFKSAEEYLKNNPNSKLTMQDMSRIRALENGETEDERYRRYQKRENPPV